MQNHKNFTVDYKAEDILAVLDKRPLPKDMSADVHMCSVKEIKDISKILNLGHPIVSILYFIMGRSFSGYIHIDKNLDNPRQVLIAHALNLPISSCKDVYMKWYKQLDLDQNESPFAGPSNGTPTPLLNYNNAVCVDEVRCDRTNLVNILDWHAIENRSASDYEYLISLRFAPYVKTSFDLPMDQWSNR